MDMFANIAKSGIQGRGNDLMIPQPTKVKEQLISLQKSEQGAKGVAVVEKISTEQELQKELIKMREMYSPYLRHLAPAIKNMQQTIELNTFSYRLDGAEERKTVTIPHYEGPLGDATAFYETEVELGNIPIGKRAFITFKGADYKANVFVNGRLVGSHEGFFASFTFDITKYIFVGVNKIEVELINDYVMLGNVTETNKVRTFGDKIYAATGPGYDDCEMGWHHCPPAMGLFDKVLIEVKDEIFINDIFTRTLDNEVEVWAEIYNCNYDMEEVTLKASLYGENIKVTIFESMEIDFFTNKEIGLGDTFTEVLSKRNDTLNKALPMYCAKGKNRYTFRISSKDLNLWQPETPYLYQLQLSVYDKKGDLRDISVSNFGVRTFKQDLQSETKGMFYLNDKPIRLRGANTMGFEQQNIMRGDLDQMIDDILLAKICNMNFLRITQRPVQQQVYEICDQLGLLIQTDLPLFGCLRRQQFCEAVRQAQEMERHVRKHPCVVVDTYINEPFPNANNLPNMNLTRAELEEFFKAADIVVRLENPDRVIKHIDGDYDPPSETMPDNHCYPMWYNGHGIDIGQLHRGYWMPVRQGWYYGCGEFGCEGLESEQTMQKYYPKTWLASDERGNWSSERIIGAQTADFYHYFYDEQNNMQQWIAESQKHQAFATRMMTEAFRRDECMVSFAIHLFIDAFPSGWMKTIMDCDRIPKLAYYAYRDALEPILLSLRTDKLSYVSGEEIKIETFLCNDTAYQTRDAKLVYEFYQNGVKQYHAQIQTEVISNAVGYHSTASLIAPDVTTRNNFSLRAVLMHDEKVLSWNEIDIIVLPYETIAQEQFIIKQIETITQNDLNEVENGKILFVDIQGAGIYNLQQTVVTVKESSMAPIHFVSRKTGHKWVKEFEPGDFRLWYDAAQDRISPICTSTFIANDYEHVLVSRNLDFNGNLQKEAILAEKTHGKGKIVLSTITYDRINQNGFGRKLLNCMLKDGFDNM